MKKIILLLMFAFLCSGNLRGQTVVYSEGFDGLWTVPTTLSPSWSGTTTATYQWHKNDFTANWNFPIGGEYSPTGAASTLGSARFHSYGMNSPITADFISPTIDLSSYTSGINILEFYFINSTGIDNLKVYLSTDNGSTWGPVLVTCNNSASWSHQTITLSTTSSTVKIKFTATSDYGDDDIGLDQVEIYNLSTPFLSVIPISLDLGYAAFGAMTAEQSYTLSGGNLTGAPGNIIVTAPSGFKVSLISGSGYNTSVSIPYANATLANTSVYVVSEPTSSNSDFYGNITNIGGGANTNIAVSGTSKILYCLSNANYTGDEDIYNVTLGTINNSSDCSTTGGTGSVLNKYSNFTAPFVAATDLARGSAYPFDIYIGTCADDYNSAIKIFIDFNQDSDFGDIGEEVFVSTASVNGPHHETGNISIPITASIGNTVMRIVNVETINPTGISACSTYDYGETEDYSVNITLPASCPGPGNIIFSNINLTSVDVDWTENGTAGSWQYEYGIQGFIPGTGNMVVTNVKPDSINGLTASTVYSIRVRSICAPGDTSSWSILTNFATSCEVAGLPYTENFDALTVPALPTCMTISNDNSDAYYWKTSSSYPYSLPNSMYIRYNSALAMDDWFYTPQFHFESGKYYKVEFYYNNDGGTTYPEKLAVKWGSTTSAAGMTEGPIFVDTNVNTDYKLGRGIINPSITGDYFVGFHGYSNIDMDILVVDDISIKEVPFADITVSQNDASNCDTLGWFNPPITIINVGQDTLMAGDTVTGTYILNAGTPVTEKFVIVGNVLPGDSATFFFTTQVHLNSYTTYNVVYSVLWDKDINVANDTKTFTVTMIAIPLVYLGADTTICNDQNITLDAGNPGATYQWWNGSANQTHFIDVSYCGQNSICSYWVEVTFNGCSNRDSISIAFDPCTGITENNSTSINLFPNPTNGVVTIQLMGITEKITVRVTSLEGQLLFSEEFENSLALSEKQFDFSNLPKGVYMLNIMNHANTIFKKLIIE